MGEWDYIENDLLPMKNAAHFPFSLSDDLSGEEIVVVCAYWEEDFVEYIMKLNVSGE